MIEFEERGKDIQDFRLNKGWSLDKMVEMSGVCKNSWIKLEHGEEPRKLTLVKMMNFLEQNGFQKKDRYCVVYQRNYNSDLDETWFDDLKKAKIFCDAQAQEIKPSDRTNGGLCIVSVNYDPENSGDYGTVVYDAVAERIRWERELEDDRAREEAKA